MLKRLGRYAIFRIFVAENQPIFILIQDIKYEETIINYVADPDVFNNTWPDSGERACGERTGRKRGIRQYRLRGRQRGRDIRCQGVLFDYNPRRAKEGTRVQPCVLSYNRSALSGVCQGRGTDGGTERKGCGTGRGGNW